MRQALAIEHIAPRKVALRPWALPELAPHHVEVRALCSAISSGTESMIFRGRFPAEAAQDSTLASLQGTFTYPFRYGYALVGEVVGTGPDVEKSWLGRTVFAYHPHQDLAVIPLSDVVPLPPHVAPADALFLANAESAVNLVLDAGPRLGERVMVIGLGVVGLITTALLARYPLGLLIGSDPVAGRRERALALGAMRTIDPGHSGSWRALERELWSRGEPAGLDLALELSGNMRALEHAIEMTGFAGRVIVGSWYGTAVHALDLGTHFHRRRIALVSSQVSSIHPALTGRWTRERRLAQAWDAIAAIGPQQFITHRLGLNRCQEAFELAGNADSGALQVVFDYE
jgi:2-desacetyl-2-hydroxyethyl bacteriochlorophyllide A dehydrogenase